jgi:hypothetical protein
MTFQQAVVKAERIAKSANETRFVIRESGEYHVASDEDLDTFFAGISDSNILYATGDNQ